MRKLLSALVCAAVLASGLSGASAGPTPGGIASDNIEYVTHIPFDAVTATGARLIGKYLYVTSWRNFSIYDVSDPLQPQLLSTRPFGFKFENEDVATNGKILLFSESLPLNALHIWDVEDKTNPTPMTSLAGAGDHTTSCILNCRWAYGSDGTIVDLRNPSEPKIAAERNDPNNWHDQTGLQGGAHDVEEFKNGFVITSTISAPLQLLDVRKPLHPKVLAQGKHPDTSFIFHSAAWPNRGRDNFLMMEAEGSPGPFMTYDTRGWQQTRTFELVDMYQVGPGNYLDGRSRSSNESSHWFDVHPDFHNGGLVTIGWYDQGTRVLDVQPDGKIKEVGYFLPYAGNTFASYWVTGELIYSVDLNRGIDVLRYTDE